MDVKRERRKERIKKKSTGIKEKNNEIQKEGISISLAERNLWRNEMLADSSERGMKTGENTLNLKKKKNIWKNGENEKINARKKRVRNEKLIP